MFVRGMGIGFAFMPAMAAAFASLERSELSHATPQLNVLQRVGGSIGTAVLAVVLQRALDRRAHAERRRRRPTAPRSGPSAGLTALAIIPCVILRARRARRPRGQGRAGRATTETLRGGDGGMSARRSRGSAA